MSDLMTDVPTAGWYQDPNDDGRMRWWDGSGWTEQVQAMAVAAPTVQVAAPASETAGEDWVSNYTVDELALYTGRTTELAAVASTTGRAVLDFTGTIPDWRRDDHSAQTPAVWLLALTPLMWIAVNVVYTMLAGATHGGSRIASLVMLVALIASSLLFAAVDGRTLARRGLPVTAPWWVLLSPLVFLVIRAVRLRRAGANGIAATIVHLLTGAALVAILGYAFVIAVGQAQAETPAAPVNSAATVHQVENSIQTDLASKGQQYTVDCSATPVKIGPGSTFTCVGTNRADQTTHSVNVTLDAEGKLSYVVAAG